MRTDREVEALVRERQRGQASVDVATGRLAFVVVGQEDAHRPQPDFAQLVDRSNAVAPDELVGVAAGLLEDGVAGRRDPRLDVGSAEGVEGIARHDPRAAASGLGIEGGGAIPAAEDAALEIGGRQGEQLLVLGERTPPGHHLIEREHGVLPDDTHSPRSSGVLAYSVGTVVIGPSIRASGRRRATTRT
jgi:hypothetical protein